MASKLNPGADATLVNAAYRAALANTPKDYSGALESVARGYEKTMQSSAEMWKDIATVGSAIGADMIKTSNEFAAAAAKGAALDSDSATFFYDEIDALKDEFKELGLLPGIFGDRETKKKRAELRLKQAELFAEIDNAANSIAQGAAAISAGTYDHSLNMRDSDMINAIIKSNLKNKITAQDNYAKLSRDEETGELMYTLYKKDGSLATLEPGGPAQTMTMTQFNEAIAKNKKDGGAMLNSLNTRIDNHYNNGRKSTDGVYDDKMRAADINFIEALLGDDPINLKRAMQTKFGYSETSFFDDITSGQNEYSAELFSTLLSVTGGGNVLKGKITEGMVDTDGQEGISAQEAMDSNNYKILTANILGLKDAKVSKEFFKQYAVKNYQDSFEYGYSKKPPKEKDESEDGGGPSDSRLGWNYNVNPTGFDSQHPDESKRQTYRDQTAAELIVRRSNLINKDPIAGNHYRYEFDKDENTWKAFYNNEYVKDVSGSNIASWEGLLSPYDVSIGRRPAFFNVGTKTEELKEQEKELAPETPGGVGLGAINTSSISEVRVNLVNILGDQFKTDFTINPVYETRSSIREKGLVTRKVPNKIKIIGPGGFEKIYDIGPNATKEIASQMTNDFSDYVKSDPFIIN
jgi:hypothetical protein